VNFMDNKKLLLCISSAVIITIFSAPFNSWAQSPGMGPHPQQTQQQEQEEQRKRQIMMQGNVQGQQSLDQVLLQRQQLIAKRVADQIAANPTQADAIIRTAVTANPGISDVITAAAIKAVPEQVAAITEAAVAKCVPGQARTIVYSAILAGADPDTIATAARKGGATNTQIKEGETRALQQLQQQPKKDTDTTAAKTKPESTTGTYNTSTSPPPSVPKPISKETQ
jgi:hypothetical protein